MSERSRDWVIDRVKKLLALGNDAGASEGERDNALRMAHALLAKYNLEMAELDSQEQGEERKVVGTVFYGRPWARMIAGSIARLFFCTYISGQPVTTGSKQTRHVFIGRYSNAVTAAELANYLIKSIQKEGSKRNDAGNAWLRSFCWGAASRVLQRVEEIINTSTKPHTDGNGRELVLASYYDTEAEANQQMLDQLFPDRVKSRVGKLTGDAGGFRDGERYGGTLHLGRSIANSSSPGPALLGVTK